MILSLIVAADEQNCIGGNNQLLWKLPDDLKRFKALTEGHSIIMGRKTFESIGKPLTKRRNIVITRKDDLEIEGVDVVHSLESALLIAEDGEPKEVFVIGGGEIYEQAMPLAHRIYFTRVHGVFQGDVYFPSFDLSEWKEISRVEHPVDDRHESAFTFIDYERRKT